MRRKLPLLFPLPLPKLTSDTIHWLPLHGTEDFDWWNLPID